MDVGAVCAVGVAGGGVMPVSYTHLLLRYHREQAGLTRMELAAQTGLAYTGIVQIEKGGSTPSLQTLRLLRKVEALRPFLHAVGTPTYRTGLRSVLSEPSALSVNGEGP